MINDLMLQLQKYMMDRRIKKIRKCDGCNEDNVPVKEVSIVNILFYLLIGVVLWFITKNKLMFLVPFPLAIINSMIVKPKCPKCKKIYLD